MAFRAARPCSWVGCPQLARAARYCEEHLGPATERSRKRRGESLRARMAHLDEGRASPSRRGLGSKWRALRLKILRRDRTCRICGLAPAKQVDHIVARRVGGTDQESNLQGVCAACHNIKTAREVLNRHRTALQ